MAEITEEQRKQLQELFLKGSLGFLSDSGLSQRKSLFINIRHSGPQKLLYAILCSLYGLSYAEQKGVDFYSTRGKQRRSILFQLRNPKVWKRYVRDRQICSAELLVNLTMEKLALWESQNKIAVHFLQNDPNNDDRVITLRSPQLETWHTTEHAYIYLLQNSELLPEKQKYYAAAYDFVSVLDHQVFTCSYLTEGSNYSEVPRIPENNQMEMMHTDCVVENPKTQEEIQEEMMIADSEDETPKTPKNSPVDILLEDSEDLLILHAGDSMESLSLVSVTI